MFNEIFVKPKLNQLKMLKSQREKDSLKLPAIPAPEKDPEEEDTVGELLAEQSIKNKIRKEGEGSLDISSLMERRRFNKNTDNLFEDGFEEEAFKKIDEKEIEQFNTQDFRDLKEKMIQPGRDISVKDEVEGDEGFESIMKNFREEQVGLNQDIVIFFLS